MWKLQCCNATVLSVNDVSSRENRLWSLSNKIEKNKALHSSEAINYVHLQRIMRPIDANEIPFQLSKNLFYNCVILQ